MHCILAALLLMSSLLAEANVDAPRILGIAHVAFRVSDLDKTRPSCSHAYLQIQ